jgi:Flp pilus assembly protein TadB
MALTQEDIQQIQKLIKEEISHVPESPNANVRYELDLRERTIRVEEELKHQRELMLAGFEQMEKRFEQVDKRFEQVDKRFEQVDKRFEQQHQEIMGLHHEIKQLIRWSFGTLLAIGGLIVAVLRISI